MEVVSNCICAIILKVVLEPLATILDLFYGVVVDVSWKTAEIVLDGQCEIYKRVFDAGIFILLIIQSFNLMIAAINSELAKNMAVDTAWIIALLLCSFRFLRTSPHPHCMLKLLGVQAAWIIGLYYVNHYLEGFTVRFIITLAMSFSWWVADNCWKLNSELCCANIYHFLLSWIFVAADYYCVISFVMLGVYWYVFKYEERDFKDMILFFILSNATYFYLDENFNVYWAFISLIFMCCYIFTRRTSC